MVFREHFILNHATPRVAAASAALFAMAALQFPALANTALGVMLLAMLATPGALRAIMRTPPVWLLGGFLLFCAAGIGVAWTPDLRAANLDAIRKFVQLWWFVPLAFWIGASDRRATLCLALAAITFVAGCLLASEWPPGEERMRLGFSSINHFAQYAAALLVGLVCFAPRAWRFAAGHGRIACVGMSLVWGTGIGLALFWVLASGSRGVWLALLLTLLATMLVAGLRHGWRTAAFGLAALMVASTLVAASLGDSVRTRLAADAESRQQLLAGEFSKSGADALGLRVRMLRAAAGYWQRAPWMGHGPAAVEGLLSREQGTLGEAGFKHLHNGFADTLVRLGILGSVLLHVLFAWVLFSAWRSLRRGQMRFDLWLAVSGVLFLALLCNQTDLRLFGWDWRNFWVLVAAIAAGPALAAAEPAPRGSATIPERERHLRVTAR